MAAGVACGVSRAGLGEVTPRRMMILPELPPPVVDTAILKLSIDGLFEVRLRCHCDPWPVTIVILLPRKGIVLRGGGKIVLLCREPVVETG